MGVVGEHSELPIECIRLSGDKSVLASSGHDQTVKFWDVRYLFEKDDESTTDTKAKSDASDMKSHTMKPPKRKAAKSGGSGGSAAAAASGGGDMSDESGDDGEGEGDDSHDSDKFDSDGEADSGMRDEKKSGANSKSNKSQSAAAFKSSIHKNNSFFDGLK